MRALPSSFGTRMGSSVSLGGRFSPVVVQLRASRPRVLTLRALPGRPGRRGSDGGGVWWCWLWRKASARHCQAVKADAASWPAAKKLKPAGVQEIERRGAATGCGRGHWRRVSCILAGVAAISCRKAPGDRGGAVEQSRPPRFPLLSPVPASTILLLSGLSKPSAGHSAKPDGAVAHHNRPADPRPS